MPDDYNWVLRGRCYQLGDNVPHAGDVIPASFVTGREMDPAVLIPHLFERLDPGFHTRCKPGDLIVTGRNFGMGPKGNGYVAMQALGLGLLCESTSVQSYRAAISTGLPVLTACTGIAALCETGDDIECDFRSGHFTNHTRNLTRDFPGVPQALQDLIAKGGNQGWLRDWWQAKQATTQA
jgi:3-isopropylmalate/(R)-2-methylmalate dehydratase small subunit